MNRSRPKTESPLETDTRHAIESSGARAWRWWAGPAAVAVALALVFLDPFIGDWDALDYTILALEGRPSSMALGRTLFIFTDHALYRLSHALFNLQPENAYLLFKGAVVAQSPLAVIACWTLARDLTRSVHAATIAALLVATSPAFVIYSGQVMTEIPSLLVLTLALIIYLRGVRSRRTWLMIAGAMLLGAGVNLRETVAFYAPWLIVAPFACGWKFGRREIARVALSCTVFLIFALGIFAFWFITDSGNYRAAWYGWRESMRMEAALHPVSPRNLLPFAAYFFLSSPIVCVALPCAAFREWCARGLSPLLALASVGFIANLLLLLNYSTTVNWRYLLTGLPALAPLVAAYLVRAQTRRLGTERRAFRSCAAGVAIVTVVFGLLTKPTVERQFEKRVWTKNYRGQLALLPRDAVVLAGGQTVAVTYWRGVGTGSWDVIGTGGGWPGPHQLAPAIERHLRDGRRVFLDADARWWSPCGWQQAEVIELAGIESRFRFRRVSDTIYEIKSPDDLTARDAPNLQSLLPENRPADVKKCRAAGRLS